MQRRCHGAGTLHARACIARHEVCYREVSRNLKKWFIAPSSPFTASCTACQEFSLCACGEQY